MTREEVIAKLTEVADATAKYSDGEHAGVTAIRAAIEFLRVTAPDVQWLKTYRAALTGAVAGAVRNPHGHIDTIAAHAIAVELATLQHGDVGPKP